MQEVDRSRLCVCVLETLSMLLAVNSLIILAVAGMS